MWGPGSLPTCAGTSWEIMGSVSLPVRWVPGPWRANRITQASQWLRSLFWFQCLFPEDLPKLERLELRLAGNCRTGVGPWHHELKNAAPCTQLRFSSFFRVSCEFCLTCTLLRCRSCRLVAAFAISLIDAVQPSRRPEIAVPRMRGLLTRGSEGHWQMSSGPCTKCLLCSGSGCNFQAVKYRMEGMQFAGM